MSVLGAENDEGERNEEAMPAANVGREGIFVPEKPA